MSKKTNAAPSKVKEIAYFNPHLLIPLAGHRHPLFDFEWKELGKKNGEKLPPQRQKKRRLIGIPNREMVALHKLFHAELIRAINQMGESNNNRDNFTLRRLPSATGCVLGSNHFKNATKHRGRRFFYITDFAHAYPSVDLRRLTLLLVFIFRYETYRLDYSLKKFARNELALYAMETDEAFEKMFSFVKFAFGGLQGEGLAVGGTLSPYLLNLYCEVYLDATVRDYCEKTKDYTHPEKEIVYSRYVDDLVFSSNTIISSERRKTLRQFIEQAGFLVNHKKSKVLNIQQGTVFVTKVGIESSDTGDVIRFPQQKRRRIEGIMKSYLVEPFQKDNPEVIRGMIAEFLHYYSQVTPTMSDKRTMALCRRFQEASEDYRKRYPVEKPRH